MNLYQQFSISIVITSLLLCGNAFAKPPDDAPPIQVDVNVVNTPLDVNVVDGPASTVLGFSTQTTTGGAGGIAGLDDICQTDFTSPDARVCTSSEVLRSPLELSMVGSADGWIQPEVVSSGLAFNAELLVFASWVTDVSGVTARSLEPNERPDRFGSNDLACTSWTEGDDGTRLGLTLDDGAIERDNCDEARTVLCCGTVP
jgi:hypothetical protein